MFQGLQLTYASKFLRDIAYGETVKLPSIFWLLAYMACFLIAGKTIKGRKNLWDCIETVSYTHLDVYKRQALTSKEYTKYQKAIQIIINTFQRLSGEEEN